MYLYVSVADIVSIGLATKRLRNLSLGDIDKIRNHLVANLISSSGYLAKNKNTISSVRVIRTEPV